MCYRICSSWYNFKGTLKINSTPPPLAWKKVKKGKTQYSKKNHQFGRKIGIYQAEGKNSMHGGGGVG